MPIRKSILRVLLVAVYLLFFSTCVEAATVRINPTKIRLIIPPGGTKTGTIEVDNPSEDSIVVKSYFEDWTYTPSHDGTKSFFPAGTMPLSCSNWITTSLSEFVVPAFGNQTIHYTIRVPEDVQGGHYAALFFESLLSQPEAKDAAQLGVLVRIGALFYIEAEEATERSAVLSNFSLERSSEREPLKMSLDLKNSGNVDITAAGTFHMMDNQGMIFARGELDNVYLFPGESARLSSSWKEPLSKGKYNFVITLDIGKALEEAKMGRGPVIIKEAEVEIGGRGEVVRVGGLR